MGRYGARRVMNDDHKKDAEDRRLDLQQIMEALYGKQGRSELARAIGVSPSTITMVLKGDREVTDKLELRLLRSLDQLLIHKLFDIYRVIDIAEGMGNRLLPGSDFKLAPLLTREEYEEEVRAISSHAARR